MGERIEGKETEEEGVKKDESKRALTRRNGKKGTAFSHSQ